MPYAPWGIHQGEVGYSETGYTATDPHSGQSIEQSIYYFGSVPMRYQALQETIVPDNLAFDVGGWDGRWPGVRTGVGRVFHPHLGGRANASSRGFPDAYEALRLRLPNLIQVQRQLKSLRTTIQKFGVSTGNYAVPSVFVPSSARNGYGQLGLG